jgi:hypothetical protein
MSKNAKKEWEKYREKELSGVKPILKDLGFELDNEQPHTSGERYLMQAVTTTSGKKLILLGVHISDKKKVVIKATSNTDGARELEHERKARQTLEKIGFAYQIFFSPVEILFTKQDKFTISIQEFIEQHPFLERPIEEQFFMALKAFKAQEGAHATTYKHRRFIDKTLGERNSGNYLREFSSFKNVIVEKLPEKRELLEKAEEFLQKNAETIEQYCGFLTHTDFVPHNFRIISDNIYLLDHSSIRFGNKYEGWARFINFMALYNPKLAGSLVKYVKDNRASEELQSLKLMRVYRLAELMYYYTSALSKSSDDLLELNNLRIDLWAEVLTHVLDDKAIPQHYLDAYKSKRDMLRSEDEKKRQVGLH